MFKPATVRKKINALAKKMYSSERFYELIEKQPDEFICVTCGNAIRANDLLVCITVVENIEKRIWYYRRICVSCNDLIRDRYIKISVEIPIKNALLEMKKFKERLKNGGLNVG